MRTSLEPTPGGRVLRLAVLCLAASSASARIEGQSAPDMLDTKHNLSASGPGPIRSATETRICIFCHTPHNATPLSPLWNRELQPQVYSLYASPTLKAGPLPQPSGPTKLCLSCHDGTIAMGAVVNPATGIDMGGAGTLPPGSPSDFGLDLSGHHPVSFPYRAALPNAELAASAPEALDYGAQDEVHCITCHNPHDDQYGRFLLMDNRGSALCVTCHQLTGWNSSAHATSTASVTGILPRPPKTWPEWEPLKDWACEACHAPHQAPTPTYLLSFTSSPPAPFSCTTAGCHSAAPGPPHLSGVPGTESEAERRPGGRGSDIARQVRKASAHHDQPGQIALTPRTKGGTRSVACADCHNPHRVNDRRAEPPAASGLLEGVRGVDRNGVEVASARYEYEICLKCHGDYAPDIDTVRRVVGTPNARLAFDTGNASYHPVLGMGRELNVPSIPSSLEPRLRPTTVIYCSSCHADDEGGGRGPHGSAWAPILKERYETTDFTSESYESYALCYRCHERTSILSDASFRRKATGAARSGGGHSGHLAAGATCSACHDPHGVDDDAGAFGTGSHTHLINFDTSLVLPAGGSLYPVFKDAGTFAGSCTLVCHGVTHDAASYP